MKRCGQAGRENRMEKGKRDLLSYRVQYVFRWSRNRMGKWRGKRMDEKEHLKWYLTDEKDGEEDGREKTEPKTEKEKEAETWTASAVFRERSRYMDRERK